MGEGPSGETGAPARPRPVTTVGSQVLRDEDDLAQNRRAVSRGAQCVDLGQHMLRRTGPLLTSE